MNYVIAVFGWIVLSAAVVWVIGCVLRDFGDCEPLQDDQL
jgi:hypothetical protein